VAKKTWKKIAMEEHHVNQQKKDGKIETLLFERSNEMEYVATTTPCTTLISFL
jgi:hypothetical protein